MIIYRALAEAIEALSRGIAECRPPEDRKLVSDYLAASPLDWLAQHLERKFYGICRTSTGCSPRRG